VKLGRRVKKLLEQLGEYKRDANLRFDGELVEHDWVELSTGGYYKGQWNSGN